MLRIPRVFILTQYFLHPTLLQIVLSISFMYFYCSLLVFARSRWNLRRRAQQRWEMYQTIWNFRTSVPALNASAPSWPGFNRKFGRRVPASLPKSWTANCRGVQERRASPKQSACRTAPNFERFCKSGVSSTIYLVARTGLITSWVQHQGS